MARSPDYLRLATNATRTLAESAFDGLREAVLVVDARAKHLPVVLANQAARDCLTPPDSAGLTESSLYGFLGAASASVIEATMASLSESDPAVTRSLTWRPTRGEVAFSTELKLLDSPQNQRLVMLTFNPTGPGFDIGPAVDQLPVGLLILDRNLHVIYANAAAVRSSGVSGSIVGRSALTLMPTSALRREAYQRALEGHSHSQGMRVPPVAGAAERPLLIDVQPLQGAAGVDGLIVISSDLNEGVLKTAHGEGERYLQSLIEDSMDIVAVAASDGKLRVREPRGACGTRLSGESAKSANHIRFSAPGRCGRPAGQIRRTHDGRHPRLFATAAGAAAERHLLLARVALRRRVQQPADQWRHHLLAQHRRTQARREPARAARGGLQARRGSGRRHHFRMGSGAGRRAPLAGRARDPRYRARGPGAGGRCLARADSSARSRCGDETDRSRAHPGTRLDHQLSHPRCPRALSLDDRARSHPAQCPGRSRARHRVLRRRLRDQAAHGPSG